MGMSGDEGQSKRDERDLMDTVPITRGDASELQPLEILLLDRYRIMGRVDRGGSASIYKARDERLSRFVAIKILEPAGDLDESVARQLEAEAEVLAALPHHGVPPVYDKGVDAEGTPFIVMKFVEGDSLSNILRRGDWSRGRLIRVLLDVCNTMAYAHSSLILHLDLKPSNIMVGEFGKTYVMDWGLARRLGDIESEADGLVMGTPSYMSPEQALGNPLDRRTDVYGLGALLLEILTGKPPHTGTSTTSIIDRATKSLAPDFRQRLDESDGHPVLLRLAHDCLQADPDHRPEDAIAVANVLASMEQSVFESAHTDMERFFELSLDMFCIAGLDGYFRRINTNFTRVLGHSEHELLDTPFLDFVHEDDREETIHVMGVLLGGQPVVRFRNRYRAADNRLVVLEWTAKSIPDEQVIFAVAREITRSDT